MPSLSFWVSWAAITTAFNIANSINSRSKNSSSRMYNAVSTLLTSLLYIASILGVGNVLVQQNNQHLLVLVAGAYSLLSTVGSVIGQEIALKYFRKVENRE